MEINEGLLRSPPRSPQWQSSESLSNERNLNPPQPRLQKRQSVRLRPSDILENAEPPSPLKQVSQPAATQRAPKMSLFNLFSRPKVERQRGYAEKGLHVSTTKEATSSGSQLNGHLQPEPLSPRPPSNVSAKTSATKASKYNKSRTAQAKEPLSLQAKDRKVGSSEAPPLFQAYPQSMKSGSVEITLEASATKTRSKGNALGNTRPATATGDGNVVDTRRMSTMKHITIGLSTNADLCKKIFVLTTSGQLLQYTESGPSDRLPEKVLHLGPHSAAFACDLIPGKHYVLQICQALDQDGANVGNSTTLLSRFGIRSAASKRIVSNFVLVLSSAEDLDSWLTSIRCEIENLGGRRQQNDLSRPATRGGETEHEQLNRTLSHSHRYQIKRNPSKVTPASSPLPNQTRFLFAPSSQRSETATIDDIELEAERLDAAYPENQSDPSSADKPSLPMMPVITAPNSISRLHDQAHAIPANDGQHVAMTDGQGGARPSLTSQGSFEGNQPLSRPVSARSTGTANNDTFTHLPNMPSAGFSSHNFSRKPPPPPLSLHSQTVFPMRASVVEESPIIPSGHSHRRASKRMTGIPVSQPSHLSVKDASKHDSKIAPLPSASVLDSIASGDMGALQQATAPPAYTTTRKEPTVSPPTKRGHSTKRVASFSMPLRVNPSSMQGLSASANPRRRSKMDEADQRTSTIASQTFTPPSDSTNDSATSYFHSVKTSPESNAERKSPLATSPPARFSLFPSTSSSPAASPGLTPPPILKRTASTISRQSTIQPTGSNGSLRRPTSVQIKSHYAPFLHSTPHTSGCPENRRNSALPIRGMKPSRSTGNLDLLAFQQAQIEALRALKFNTPTLLEEDDLAMPLPPEPQRPASQGGLSNKRLSSRKSLRGPMSLTEIEFGLPAIALGPPAPPPRVPLPLPPVAARTGSPTYVHKRSISIDSATDLGIRVS